MFGGPRKTRGLPRGRAAVLRQLLQADLDGVHGELGGRKYSIKTAPALRAFIRVAPDVVKRLDQEHADRTDFRAIGRVIAPWGRRIGDARFETDGAWKRNGVGDRSARQGAAAGAAVSGRGGFLAVRGCTGAGRVHGCEGVRSPFHAEPYVKRGDTATIDDVPVVSTELAPQHSRLPAVNSSTPTPLSASGMPARLTFEDRGISAIPRQSAN